MRLYEYEGKKLFAAVGIPIPAGILADDEKSAALAADELGYPVYIKAQVARGGRGKAGLVKEAATCEELEQLSGEILAKAAPGTKLLVEEKATASMEGYAGITVDDVAGKPVLVIHKAGGIHIEETAEEKPPEKMYIEPLAGLRSYEILALAKRAGYSGKALSLMASLVEKLYKAYRQYEIDTMEINPVLIDERSGKIWAGDAKVVTDDYVTARQPALQEFERERRMRQISDDDRMTFVDLSGNIGIISVGASNTMMLTDTMRYMGGSPANFLDTTGSGGYEEILEIYKKVLKDFAENPDIAAVMINYTLTAQPLENYAGAAAEAVRLTNFDKPKLACIRATDSAVRNMSVKEANELLERAGVETYDSLLDAIEACVQISVSRENEENVHRSA